MILTSSLGRKYLLTGFWWAISCMHANGFEAKPKSICSDFEIPGIQVYASVPSFHGIDPCLFSIFQFCVMDHCLGNEKSITSLSRCQKIPKLDLDNIRQLMSYRKWVWTGDWGSYDVREYKKTIHVLFAIVTIELFSLFCFFLVNSTSQIQIPGIPVKVVCIFQAL